MLKKKFIIPLVGLCLVSLIFSAYKVGTLKSYNTGINKTLASSTSTLSPSTSTLSLSESTLSPSTLTPEPEITPKKEAATENLSEDNSPAPTENALPSTDNIESKITEITDGVTFLEAKENGLYSKEKGIMIDKKIMVALEWYRVVVNESSFSTGKYYVVADLSIINLSNTNYISSLSNFTLKDSNGYSYTAAPGPNTRGDISGNLKFKDSRRGEISFYVPGTETDLELYFNTGLEEIKTIRFKIDTNSLVNPPLPKK